MIYIIYPISLIKRIMSIIIDIINVIVKYWVYFWWQVGRVNIDKRCNPFSLRREWTLRVHDRGIQRVAM